MIRSVRKVAWKTGTSYGYRDAWAVGVTPAYAVGVWAGNASGAGAPGLLGARTAGPVMFEIFNLLPARSAVLVFRAGHHGGHQAGSMPEVGLYCLGPYCESIDTLLLPKTAVRSATCPYHSMEDGRNVFRLTPAMEWFYRRKHPEYDAATSKSSDSAPVMEFIYPENGSRITIPRQLDGSIEGIVLNLAHHDKDATVYWHIDQEFIGTTRFIHQMRIRPEAKQTQHHSRGQCRTTGIGEHQCRVFFLNSVCLRRCF